MIFYPQDTQTAWTHKGVFRAGATDLFDRQRKGLIKGDSIELREVAELSERPVISEDGIISIPAMVTITELNLASTDWGHQALTMATRELATPAIRNTATVGGNLLQEVRCSYFRSGQIRCHKTGGQHCPARQGDHRYLSGIDLGGCIAPHPSTLAMVFACLGAYVDCTESSGFNHIAIEDLWLKPKRRLIHRILLPLSGVNDISHWQRISNRTKAEWPLVEVALYIQLFQNKIARARCYVGGLAKYPFSLDELADILEDQSIYSIQLDRNKNWLSSMKWLEQSKYKSKLLAHLICDAFEQVQQQL